MRSSDRFIPPITLPGLLTALQCLVYFALLCCLTFFVLMFAPWISLWLYVVWFVAVGVFLRYWFRLFD